MEPDAESVKTLFEIMASRGERSPLFWWFVENHDEFAEGCRRQRIQWTIVVERVSVLGLTNRLGVVPTPKLAKQTWHRAKRYVAAVRVGQETPIIDPPPAVCAGRFAMPRPPNAHPILAEASTDRPADLLDGVYVEADSLVYAPAVEVRTTVLEAPATSRPGSFSPVPVAVPATPRAREKAPLTPEQIGHRDAQIAKARARHAITDRFLNIKE